MMGICVHGEEMFANKLRYLNCCIWVFPPRNHCTVSLHFDVWSLSYAHSRMLVQACNTRTVRANELWRVSAAEALRLPKLRDSGAVGQEGTDAVSGSAGVQQDGRAVLRGTGRDGAPWRGAG